MKTEASRIVDSPTGTMKRVLTEEGFDPDRASTFGGIVSPICFAVFTIDGRFEFRRLLDGKIGARSTSGETVS